MQLCCFTGYETFPKLAYFFNNHNVNFQCTKLNSATLNSAAFDLNLDICLIVQLTFLSAEALKEVLQGSRILIIEEGTYILSRNVGTKLQLLPAK